MVQGGGGDEQRSGEGGGPVKAGQALIITAIIVTCARRLLLTHCHRQSILYSSVSTPHLPHYTHHPAPAPPLPAQLPSHVVESLRIHCPLLEELMLDACDLGGEAQEGKTGGYTAGVAPYSALQVVKVRDGPQGKGEGRASGQRLGTGLRAKVRDGPQGKRASGQR